MIVGEGSASVSIVGPPDGRPIVFVHGTRATHAFWAPQQARLGDTYRTVTLDLPGHGTRAAEPFTLDGAVDVVARAIDESAGGRAVVVGLSLGGYVALTLAARSPERVRGLVLAGATAEPTGVLQVAFRVFGWALGTFSGRAVDAGSRWFFARRYPPEIADPILRAGFWPVGGAQAVRAIARERFLPRMAAYQGPTLFLNGEWDLPFRLGGERFATVAANPRRMLIRRATHLSNLERPDAFNTAIRRFMSSLEGTP